MRGTPVERGAVIVERHGARSPRPPRRRRSDGAAFFRGLGHPNGGEGRGALQSDVLSQWLDLAARQRANRARACTLWPQAFGRAFVQGPVRRRPQNGLPPAAEGVPSV